MKNFLNIPSRYVSLLFAFSNCLVGCSLGFYYGQITLSTLFIAFCMLVAGVGVQSLCNYSISYSRAYQKHKSDKKLGIVWPIMIGQISLNSLKKRMAILTVMTAFFGGLAIYLSMGNNIQILSWFIFLCAVGILMTSFFTINTENIYENISAHIIFFIFSVAAIASCQIIVVCASTDTLDFYPDTLFLGVNSGIASLMFLYVKNIGMNVHSPFLFKYKLSKVIKYELSTVYLIALMVAYCLTSVVACVTSHKAIEAILIILGYIPMFYLVYVIIKLKNRTNQLRLRLGQLMFNCCINNFIWIGILIIDYSLYS